MNIKEWYGYCHWCNRAVSVSGAIGDDGLCSFCRKKGRQRYDITEVVL